MIKQYWQTMLIGFYIMAAASLAVAANNTKTQAQLYRYTNEKGEVVLSNQVPPEQAVRGYEVIDKNGQVKQTIAPALTPEEKEAKKIEDARKENDKRLLGLYSSYEDFDRAREAEMGKIKSATILIEGNINGLMAEREKTQATAADLERSGKKVPDDITKKLFDIDNHLKIENKKLQEQQGLEKKTLEQFTADRIRLGELLNLPSVAPASGAQSTASSVTAGSTTTTQPNTVETTATETTKP